MAEPGETTMKAFDSTRRLARALASAALASLAAATAPTAAEAGNPMRVENSSPHKLWPNAEIPYEISPTFTTAEKDRIGDAIDSWNELSPVKLVHVSDTPGTDPAYARFEKTAGCESQVGRVGEGAHPIRLGSSCAPYEGGILHEIGHAAGLWHEHQRSDRGAYLTVSTTDYWWQVDPVNGVPLNRYDYESVMHYAEYVTSTVDGVSIPGKHGDALSDGDIAALAALYVPLADHSAPNDEFGSAFAACDFDADGLEDLAIGAPGDWQGGGLVNVVYGSGAGLSSLGNERVGPGAPGDRLGAALAAGHFDAGPYCDLAVGSPGKGAGAGEIRILYGSPQGLGAVPSEAWTQDSPYVPDAREAGDQFGSTLEVGDFDRNGFDDLAVGSPGESVWVPSAGVNQAGAGVVHVFYASSSGTGISGAPIQLWHQGHGLPELAETLDLFGQGLAAGDFDGNGYDDLAVGVPGEDASRGIVQVLRGGSWGLASTGSQLWRQGGVLGDGAEAGDRFGFSLAAADFDGDGRSDLAVGAPYEDLVVGGTSYADAGAVSVLYGSTTGLALGGGQFWHQASANVEGQVEAGDRFGYALAGREVVFGTAPAADLAIGVPGEDIGAIADAGSVNVLRALPDTGLVSTVDQGWHQSAEGIEETSDTGDQLGTALEAGDFDGDGNEDLAIGAPFEDLRMLNTQLHTNAGAVNVLYEDVYFGPGLSAEADQVWHQSDR
jgi:hypothetical protein